VSVFEDAEEGFHDALWDGSVRELHDSLSGADCVALCKMIEVHAYSLACGAAEAAAEGAAEDRAEARRDAGRIYR
jgi:hypothetical protein